VPLTKVRNRALIANANTTIIDLNDLDDVVSTSPTDGQVLTWDNSNSYWEPADASGGSGQGVTVYATIDDLPLSGVTEGSQALVDSTDTLYIWSDNGWYKIALVNTTPSISNVESTYTLSSDGTATVINIVAEDPEGIPITYSIASDTSGDIATVTQGSGNTANEFTITPSTNTALDGQSFSLTFRASDGVNIATAASTFSLTFNLAISNSKYTTALITSVGGNNDVNNDIVDSSSSAHTITVNGDTTQTTFSPYRSGGYSTYFDGTGDYLSIADDATLRLGSGEFTVECWIYMHSLSRTVFIDKYDGTSAGWQLQYRDYNNVNHIAFSTSAGHYATTPSDEIEANTWYHVAAVRDSSNNVKIYIDGTEKGSSSSYTQDLNGTSALNIGVQTYNIAAGYMNGYISDARIVKGTAVYTSAFTPPTERLTAITNTNLLTCHLPYIADGSTNSHTITIAGNTKTEPFAPYDYETYSASDHGGSMYFDGSSNITVADDASLEPGSGDFCVEFWLYPLATTANETSLATKGWSFGNYGPWLLYTGTSSNYVFYASSGSTWDISGLDTGWARNDFKWQHLCFSREGNTYRFFKDGKQTATTTNSATLMNNSAAVALCGDAANGRQHAEAIVSDFRYVVGSAVRTSNFTPSTAPLTAITNTSLLLSGTNAGIIDKSQSVKSLILNGDVKSSTTQTKYLSSSMYFDGTGDSITIGNNRGLHIGSGDFTMEMWFRAAAVNTNQVLIMRRASAAARGLVMNINSSAANKLGFVAGDSDTAGWEVSFNSTSDLSADTWHHAAIVRSGNNFYLYLDGTREATASSSATIADDTSNMLIGVSDSNSSYFSGYISDLRITKGLARYTAADETANIPSAALEG
jgi:hypothetical protein